jgi:hypothetical protein
MATVLLCEGMMLELCDTGGLTEVVMAGMVLVLGDDDGEGRVDGSIGKRDKGISLIC